MPSWISILQALLTPAIAMAVGIVAFLQWRTAHQKVVLDLFDRRFAVYQNMRSIVDDAVLFQGSVDKELLIRIHRLYQDAAFLFGNDVVAKISKLEKVLMQIEMVAVVDLADQQLSDLIPHRLSEAIDVARLRTKAADLLGDIAITMKGYMHMDQRRIRTPSEWFADRNRLRLSHADEKQK